MWVMVVPYQLYDIVPSMYYNTSNLLKYSQSMRSNLKGPTIMFLLLETISVIIHLSSYMYIHKIKQE